MKAASIPAVINPTILILSVLFFGVAYIGFKGIKLPLLSNPKIDIVLLVVLGMAICTQGGIGRVAAAGQWAHPQAILGYILGVLILIVALAAFTGWKLPLVQTEQQALLAIAVLVALKFANAILHSLLFRS